jgi:hypothetical protein
MRPTRRFTLSKNSKEVIGRFEKQLDGGQQLGEILGNHVTLKIAETDLHFWSPWLQIEIKDQSNSNEQTSFALARFSPHPSIWTGFALTYLGLGTIIAMALCFGVSQVTVGYYPSAFWAVPVCLVLMLALFAASQFGQWLAQDQMQTLEEKMMAVLDPVLASPEQS